MAKLPTAARVLNHARPKTIPPFKDVQIIAACEQCGIERRLSECEQEETERARNYRCSGCGEILVITRAPNPGAVPIPDSGYRLGDWVFANAVNVRIEGLDGLSFPAMRNATTVDIRTKDIGDIDKASGK
jgi:hypothetical protein